MTMAVKCDIRSAIRPMIKSFYDLQLLRIQTGGRIVANFRAKMGFTVQTNQDGSELTAAQKREMKKQEKSVMDTIRADYRLLTKALADKRGLIDKSDFTGQGVISAYTEYVLVQGYMELERNELSQLQAIQQMLTDYPIYNEWLGKVVGIGPTMAGLVVGFFDIHRSKYPSSLTCYCGYDVGDDFVGRSRRVEHQRVIDYTDKNGEPAQKMGLTFDPFLKTKMYVLVTCLIRAGNKRYKTLYNNYVHRLRTDPNRVWPRPKAKKAHSHAMAMRYVVKFFLRDLYYVWRPLEGLDTFRPYEETKMMIKHTGPEESPFEVMDSVLAKRLEKKKLKAAAKAIDAIPLTDETTMVDEDEIESDSMDE